MSNTEWQPKPMPGCTYNAGELLDLMRFDTEGLLIDCKTLFPGRMPECLSQSHRAKRALDLIEERMDRLREDTDVQAIRETIFELFKLRNRLEKFLAVHECVNILERRHRDPDGTDCFGFDLPKKEEET